MKPEKFIYAMNDIDTVFLNEAREDAAPSVKSHRSKFVALLAAVIALMAITLTAFAAEEIAGWFVDFLEKSNFVPESWSDASVTEDYSEELLTEPVSGIPAYQFDGDGVIDLTVVSVRLRPDILMFFYRATNSADHELLSDYYPGGVKVVMQDGTDTILTLSSVGRISEDSDSLYWIEYAANVPPVDRIDYIEFANGTKLMIP